MLLHIKKIIMKANSEQTLHHIAEQLRDGLCPIASMIFEKNTFSLLVNRFCWNHEDQKDKNVIYFRAHLGLLFKNVTKVTCKGFKNTEKWKILNLLHINTTKQNNEFVIDLLFSNHCDIRIHVSEIEVFTRDLHEAWPTLKKPTHIHEHLELINY